MRKREEGKGEIERNGETCELEQKLQSGSNVLK